MIISISGTPGTGKTTLARKLAKTAGYKYLNVGRLIKSKNIAESYDRKRRCYVVDIKKLNKVLIEKIRKFPDIIIDSHLSHYLPKEYVNLCIITKCSLKALEGRLKKKRYSKQKIRENLDCEIFDVCLNEAKEAGHKVIVVDTTKGFKIKELVKKIK